MMALSGVRISWLILARNSDFCALAALGGAARRDQLLLDVLPVRDVAEHRAEFARLAEPAHGHEQRDQAALRHLADHLAPVIEDARDAVLGEPVEIVERRLAALLGEELGERLRRAPSPASTPNSASALRLMLPIRPSPVDDDDAVGGGVEDRLELVDRALGAPAPVLGRASSVRVRCRLRARRPATASAPSPRPTAPRGAAPRPRTSAPSRRRAASRPLGIGEAVPPCCRRGRSPRRRRRRRKRRGVVAEKIEERAVGEERAAVADRRRCRPAACRGGAYPASVAGASRSPPRRRRGRLGAALLAGSAPRPRDAERLGDAAEGILLGAGQPLAATACGSAAPRCGRRSSGDRLRRDAGDGLGARPALSAGVSAPADRRPPSSMRSRRGVVEVLARVGTTAAARRSAGPRARGSAGQRPRPGRRSSSVDRSRSRGSRGSRGPRPGSRHRRRGTPRPLAPSPHRPGRR